MQFDHVQLTDPFNLFHNLNLHPDGKQFRLRQQKWELIHLANHWFSNMNNIGNWERERLEVT